MCCLQLLLVTVIRWTFVEYVTSSLECVYNLTPNNVTIVHLSFFIQIKAENNPRVSMEHRLSLGYIHYEILYVLVKHFNPHTSAQEA